MKKQPNIVLYFSDQQRADTIGCYNDAIDFTPNLDTLAAEGLQYAYAFTAQPVCGPCRAIFQTGRYPTETGCFRNNIALPPGTRTLAQRMYAAGYDAAYVGKWHLASTGPLEGAPEIDYQRRAIPPEYRGGYTGYWRASDLLEFTSDSRGGYLFDEHMQRHDFVGYRCNCITDYALEYLDQTPTDQPFFLTISHIEPHHQNNHGHYEGPEGSKDRFKNYPIPDDLTAFEGDYREEYPDYLGCCASLDENLGRIIAKLREKSIYDNTVVIYVSDHGSHFKTRNRDKHLCGYDDYKRSCHDACLRVPLIIGGGAIRKKKLVKDLVSTISLPKTILRLAGSSEADELCGEDLIAVANSDLPKKENHIFAQISESRVGRVLRTERYKLAVVAAGMPGGEYAAVDRYVGDFLYDLAADPCETRNLIDDTNYADIRAALYKILKDEIYAAERVCPVLE